MDKLHTILLDSALQIVEQDTSTIEAYSSLHNFYRVIVPSYDTSWIPFATFKARNNSGVEIQEATEKLLFGFVDTISVEGVTHYIYEQPIPPSTLNNAKATALEVVASFLKKENALIGASLYDENAVGYNDTTYIAAQLLVDYPDAVTDDIVRVLNTDTDWQFDGAAWVDEGAYILVEYTEHVSELATYAIRKGLVKNPPTHAPTNTEQIISVLNDKINRTEVYNDFYTKTYLDSFFSTEFAKKVNVAGDTMTGNLDMNQNEVQNISSLSLYNAADDKAIAVYNGTSIVWSYRDVNAEMFENLFVRVKADEDLANGDVIQYTGQVGASGRIRVKKAVPAEVNANPSLIVGIATQAITSGNNGLINWYGAINDLDTLGLTAGGIIYFASESASAGEYTQTEPTAPNVQIKLGIVSIVHNTQGQIKIRPNVGLALGELHDIYLNGGVSDGDIIKYNLANGRWEAFNIDNALDLKEDIANKGQPGGYTPLNGAGIVDPIYVPGAYTDYVEYATYADLPVTGEEGVLYVVLADETSGDNTSTYRWTGTIYVNVTDKLSAAEVKALYETNTNTNAFTDADKAQVDEVVNKIPKDFTAFNSLTSAIATTNDIIVVRDISTNETKKMTLQELLDYLFTETDVFNSTVDYSDNGLGANFASHVKIHQLFGGSGAYAVGVRDIADNLFAIVQFPDTSADTSTTTQVSFDAGVTLRTLKTSEGDIPANQLSNSKVMLYRDGTVLYIYENESLTKTVAYTGADGQHTIGENGIGHAITKKVNTIPKDNRGRTFAVVASDNAVIDTGTISFTSVSGINYYDTLNETIVAGTGGTLTFTNSSGATASMMAFQLPSDITTVAQAKAMWDGTFLDVGLHSVGKQRTYTASDYPSKVQAFIEAGGVVEGDLIRGVYTLTVDKNKFDEKIDITSLPIFLTNSTLIYEFYGVPNTQYTLSSDIAQTNPANIYFNGGSTVTNGVWSGKSVTVTSDDTGYLFIYFRYNNYESGSQTIEELNNAIKDGSNYIQLELGTSATKYETYNPTVSHLDTEDYGLPSLSTTVYDTETNQAIGVETGVSGTATINDTLLPLIDTSGIFIAVDETTGETQSGSYGDTLALSNPSTVYYQLATAIPRTLEIKGEQIVSPYSTWHSYGGGIVPRFKIESPYSLAGQADINVDTDIKQGKQIANHENRLDIVEGHHTHIDISPLMAGASNPAFIPDYDYTEGMFLFPQNDTTEVALGTYFMPDNRVDDTPVYLRVHAYQSLDLQPVMKIDYKVFEIEGGTVPASYTTGYTLDTWETTYVSGTISNVLVNTTPINTTGLSGRLVIKYKVYRDDNVYTGDLKVDEIGIKYTKFNIDTEANN